MNTVGFLQAVTLTQTKNANNRLSHRSSLGWFQFYLLKTIKNVSIKNSKTMLKILSNFKSFTTEVSIILKPVH